MIYINRWMVHAPIECLFRSPFLEFPALPTEVSPSHLYLHYIFPTFRPQLVRSELYTRPSWVNFILCLQILELFKLTWNLYLVEFTHIYLNKGAEGEMYWTALFSWRAKELRFENRKLKEHDSVTNFLFYSPTKIIRRATEHLCTDDLSFK